MLQDQLETNMAKASIDTNVLLRLLLNDIPEQHEKAKRLIQEPGLSFQVSDTAIIELVFVLERHYEFARAQIRDAVDALATITSISFNKNLMNKALSVFIEHPKLSFEDCYLVSVAVEQKALPLWTFDKKLASQNEYAQIVP